jgi:hypothetical protein
MGLDLPANLRTRCHGMRPGDALHPAQVKPRRAAPGTGRHACRKRASLHEERFARLWQALSGPELVREHRFCARRWRFDFAHLPSLTAIEIEGGIHRIGRHQRPAGFQADLEKYHAAALLGWQVWRLSPSMVSAEHVRPIVERTRRAG